MEPERTPFARTNPSRFTISAQNQSGLTALVLTIASLLVLSSPSMAADEVIALREVRIGDTRGRVYTRVTRDTAIRFLNPAAGPLGMPSGENQRPTPAALFLLDWGVDSFRIIFEFGPTERLHALELRGTSYSTERFGTGVRRQFNRLSRYATKRFGAPGDSPVTFPEEPDDSVGPTWLRQWNSPDHSLDVRLGYHSNARMGRKGGPGGRRGYFAVMRIDDRPPGDP